MRSLLFVPGDSERKLSRAPQSGADAVIVDLEDSVVPANRPLARNQARAFLTSTGAGGFRRYVRINPLASGAALDDLSAVAPGKPDGILLPKCVPEDLRTLDHYLAALEAAFAIPPATIQVIAIATETPAAMFALGGYSGVSTRLEAITWGAEDLAACLGANNRRADGIYDDVYRLARSLCLLGAAAAGIDRDRYDLHRLQGRDGAGRRMRGRQAIGLCREDGDPSGAGSGNQPRLFRYRGRTRLGPQGCDRLRR